MRGAAAVVALPPPLSPFPFHLLRISYCQPSCEGADPCCFLQYKHCGHYLQNEVWCAFIPAFFLLHFAVGGVQCVGKGMTEKKKISFVEHTLGWLHQPSFQKKRNELSHNALCMCPMASSLAGLCGGRIRAEDTTVISPLAHCQNTNPKWGLFSLSFFFPL